MGWRKTLILFCRNVPWDFLLVHVSLAHRCYLLTRISGYLCISIKNTYIIPFCLHLVSYLEFSAFFLTSWRVQKTEASFRLMGLPVGCSSFLYLSEEPAKQGTMCSCAFNKCLMMIIRSWAFCYHNIYFFHSFLGNAICPWLCLTQDNNFYFLQNCSLRRDCIVEERIKISEPMALVDILASTLSCWINLSQLEFLWLNFNNK